MVAIVVISGSSYGVAQTTRWRTATKQELRKLIPARAPVIKENIETEFRTASGVFDGQGKYVAGVVMITAGYSAEGKYSHFFITQVPLQRLYFLNSDFVMDQTRALATRLTAAGQQDDSKKISWLYELLFTREASQEEIRTGLDFLQRNSMAWPEYIQALISTNQFSFVD